MNSKKISTVNRSVSAILEDINSGKFAIPRLQREFVWDGPRVAKLIDSIYKGMPIGAVLVWETAKANKLYLREKYHVLPPFNDRNKKVWFLIDGQQRLSALHCISKGEIVENSKGKKINFKHIVFSLSGKKNDQRFFYRKAVPGQYISVKQILDNSQCNHLGLNKSHLAVIREVRKNILDYKALMVRAHMKIDEVRECFLRINTQGMKVTTADAIFSKAEALDLRDFAHEVRQYLGTTFQRIEDMPILWTLVALEGESSPGRNYVERAIRKIEKEAIQNKSLKKKIGVRWRYLKQCFGKSVDYLKENFNVISTEYLYSPYMISMLALFYYYNRKGPDQKQKVEIRKWFWATTVASRYSGRNFYKCLKADVAFFERLAKNKNARFKTEELAHAYDIRKTSYDSTSSGIGSAFYCLLFQKKPANLLDDGLNIIPLAQFTTAINKKNRHHIFPRSLMTHNKVNHSDYNSLCNICLLTVEENTQIGNNKPSDYLKESRKKTVLFAKKMGHHLIPYDDKSGLWEKNIKKGFHQFVRQRQELIIRTMEQGAGIRLFRNDR